MVVVSLFHDTPSSQPYFERLAGNNTLARLKTMDSMARSK